MIAMHFKIFISIFLFLFCVTKECISRDSKESKLITFQINNSNTSNSFFLKLIENNNKQIFDSIVVFRFSDSAEIQRIKLNVVEKPYSNEDAVIVFDFNLDGSKDFFVLNTWGVTGNKFGDYYLYNSGSGKFEKSNVFGGLFATYDTAQKLFYTTQKGGNQKITREYYKIVNNQTLIMKIEEIQNDTASGMFRKKIYKIIENKRVLECDTLIGKM